MALALLFNMPAIEGWDKHTETKMMKTMSLKSGMGVGLCALAMSQIANAASISYYLDQNNAGLAQNNYLQVTISDSLTVAGDIDFSIQTLGAFDALNPGSNFGMQSFYFNFDMSQLSISTANVINLNPVAWRVALSNSNVSQYGRFDISTTGNGSTRTDLLSFTISGVANDTINSYASVYSDVTGNNTPQLFAAHVGGFDNGSGISSAYFAGSSLAVPVPAAAWLFGSGLLALAGLINRRRK
jgi:hypothetical protein